MKFKVGQEVKIVANKRQLEEVFIYENLTGKLGIIKSINTDNYYPILIDINDGDWFFRKSDIEWTDDEKIRQAKDGEMVAVDNDGSIKSTDPKDALGIKKVEGENRQFSTGAHKQAATGKGTPVLFPADAYLEISKHFENGAELHGARNWEKGIPLSELINSLERHIAQEKLGMTDERHDRALAWNAVVYLATKLRIQKEILPKELSDIPKVTEK